MQIGNNQVDAPVLIGLIASLLLLPFLERWRHRYDTPRLFFSHLASLQPSVKRLRVRFAWLPRLFFLSGFICLMIALLDPHRIEEKVLSPPKQQPLAPAKPPPTEGLAIYIVVDQSLSMLQVIEVQGVDGRMQRQSKIELLKDGIARFVKGDSTLGLQGRPNDLIGLVAFARSAQVLVPLTLNHQVLLEKLAKLDAMRIKDQDGTSIGYAIYKTAGLIAATRHFAEEIRKEGKPAYEIKQAVMILITDGLQDPNPLDENKQLRNIEPWDAAKFAQQQNIKLYIINIEPRIASSEFEPHRRMMQKTANLTGGRFFTLGEKDTLQKIYQEIDALEKSQFEPLEEEPAPPTPEPFRQFTRISTYPDWIIAGLVCLLLGSLLTTMWLRRFP